MVFRDAATHQQPNVALWWVYVRVGVCACVLVMLLSQVRVALVHARARIWVQQDLYNLGSEHFIPIFGPHVSSQRAAQVRQLYTVCVCVCV